MPHLDNSLVRLGFDAHTGMLTHLLDLEGEVVHVAPPDAPRALWKLTFHAGTDVQHVSAPGEDAAVSVEVKTDNAGTQIATLTWRGITLRNEKDALDVVVTVSLPKALAASEWRIRVANRSTRYGLSEVAFPWFNGWPEPNRYDLAVPWYNWGRNYKKVADKHQGEFSSYTWSMQFFVLSAGGRGISIAAHDSRQFYKKYVVDPGNETAMVLLVPNAGMPGTGLDETYPIVINTHAGGWFEGCKLFRSWAIKQPWTAKGPISQRSDVPRSLKDIGLWLISSYPSPGDKTTPKAWADEIIDAAHCYDVPVGVHIYQWHEIPFDNHYPEYFPTKPGFAEQVRRLVDAGIVAMPYINARLWDSQAKSYPGAIPSAAKDPAGVPYLEIYSPQSGRLVPMCTQTKLWQDTVVELCRRIIEEVGANAIYLDQVAAMPAAPCYDPTHGHTIGGGDHWHAGYRIMLNRIKDLIARTGREVVITTENPGDAHIDGCDAFLIWNPRADDEVPMMTAVYSGYALYFSSPHVTDQGLQSFVMAQGRDFIWGSQLGWMSPQLPQPCMEYLRTLGKCRVQTRKFLTYGELVGELVPISDPPKVKDPAEALAHPASVPTVSAVWPWWGQIKPGTLPAVMSSIWRAEDGHLGLFIVNLSEQERTFHCAYDPARYGLAGRTLTDAKLLYTPITTDGPGKSVQASGGVQLRTEKLPPRGVVIYEVAPES